MVLSKNTARWWMLALLSLTLITLTLNWFDIAAAFPQISKQLGLGVSELSNLIGLFILGFAIFHIPAGMLAYRIGVKNTLLLGLIVESLGGVACAFAPDYGMLALLRLVTGIGGSFIVGMTLSLITSWFRNKELALAMGISGAGCFTLGQVLGISAWTGVIALVGWQVALVLGGVFGLITFLLCLLWLRVPQEEAQQLSGGTFTWKAVGRVMGNRDLWFAGLSFFGVYGGGLLAIQLLPTYLHTTYAIPLAVGSTVFAGIFVILAIPGAIAGGILAQISKNMRAVFVIPWALLGLSLCLFPLLGLLSVWIMIVVAGLGQQFGFSPWSSLPGLYRDKVFPEDVATAEGLMLTAGGLGGFIIPAIFGVIQTNAGYGGAFVFAGIASIVFAFLGFAAREPQRATPMITTAPVPAPEPVAVLDSLLPENA